MLQNADPTGEIQPDSQELLDLEEECYMMGPLIDQKLQDIDQQHAVLEDLNFKILEAFQMYNNLMKESITKTAALISNVNVNPPLPNPANLYNHPTNSQSINYSAAPPSLEANSLSFANKLNSIAGLSQLPNQANILSSASGTNLAPGGNPAINYANQTAVIPPQNGFTSNPNYPTAMPQVTSSLPPNPYSNMYLNNGTNGLGAPEMSMNQPPQQPLNYAANSFVN